MSTPYMKRFNRVHFVGIGGAGMCGIAEVMLNLGYQVSGSDTSQGPNIDRLRRLGATIHHDHAAANVDQAHVVVASTAIARSNPELARARERRIPVVPRAEMLGELMRFREGIAVAGTHGKTTTTSLIATLLDEGGLDPTFVIGGLVNAFGTNARLGEGSYLVAEADESDGSFLMLVPTIAVVTNIDRDHLESYEHSYLRLLSAFGEFIRRLPFYGLAVLCRDDPGVRQLLPELKRNVVTYGLSPEADIRAENLRQEGATMHFDVRLPGVTEPFPVHLHMPGEHNVRNALAAIAVALDLGVSTQAVQAGLERFAGIGRRFNQHGQVRIGGHQVTLIDDYAHHPTELAATLDAARGGWPQARQVVVFQPHRYTRTHDLLDDFARVLAEADVLLVTEVYAAGEEPIAGASARDLCRVIRARGQVDPVLLDAPEEAIEALENLVEAGDVVLFLGAGNINAVAATLAQEATDED